LRGKKALVLIENSIDPETLMGYDVDAFVSTACPRLAIDDYLRFKKPIITPKELEIVLGERDWKDYEFDSILD
ncbi:MAG TPA: diphthamide synthesis protein, partial [Methanomassiliicoccales archaeon]|nr:diphthamide synthesis protein [Methanomassiliicoccales archaeon]